MKQNKKMSHLESQYPDLYSDISIKSINYSEFLKLDEKTMNLLFSDDLYVRFRVNFINYLYVMKNGTHKVLIDGIFQLYRKGKKNIPMLNNEELVLAILKRIPECSVYYAKTVIDYFKILSDELKNDKDIVKEALRLYRSGYYNYFGSRRRKLLTKAHYDTYYNFPEIGKKLADNENFIREEFWINPYIMDYASSRLKNNINLMMLCAEKAGGYYAYSIAGKDLKYNKDFIITCVKNGLSLDSVKRIAERKDFDIGLAAISFSGYNIRNACDELKKDKRISLYALNNGASMLCLDGIFKDDKEIVMEAVRSNGCNLKHVVPPLNKDLEVITRAVESNGDALEYIPFKKYRADKGLVIKAIKSSRQAYVFDYIHPTLRKDKDFMLQAIEVYSTENAFAPLEGSKRGLYQSWSNDIEMSYLVKIIHRDLLRDKKFISKAAEICPFLLKCGRFPGTKIYKKVAANILKVRPDLFPFVDRNDEHLASIAIKQDPEMVSWLGYRLKNKPKFKK